MFDGDGTGDAKRAVEVCRGVASADDSDRFGEEDIGTGLGPLEEPSPLSAMSTQHRKTTKSPIVNR